jgi:hypothetical protein
LYEGTFALPDRTDVDVAVYHAHVDSSGLSDTILFQLPDGLDSVLFDVRGGNGRYQLHELDWSQGDGRGENLVDGGIVTRHAREAPGQVNWLYPNAPNLSLAAGKYRMRVFAGDASGNGTDDDIDLYVYRRAERLDRCRLDLEIEVVAGAVDDGDDLSWTEELAGLIARHYQQVAIDVNFLGAREVTLAQPDVDLTNRSVAVRPALANAAPGAIHLVLVRSLLEGHQPATGDQKIGYSLGLPGPYDAARPNAGVLVTSAPPAGDGSLDLERIGVTCAHEIGHYLGLYHTSEDPESAPNEHDPIPDTSECGGPGGCATNNIMFYQGGGARSVLTAGQGTVMRRHPLCQVAE